MKLLWTKPSLSRDFALLSGLIIFILMVVSVWVSVETFDAHSDKTIKQLEAESTRVDRAMIIEIERASYLIESLGRQINEVGTDNLDAIAKLLKSFDTNAIANNVLTFVDSSQQVVVSSNKGVLSRTVDVSDRDYIKKSLAEPWKVQIGRPIQGRVSEKWVLPIGIGITDNSGKYLGTISISLDIASLSRELQNVIKKSGISFAIFSKTLILLTDNDGHITTSEFFMNSLKKIDYEAKPSGILSLGSVFDPKDIYAYYETSASYPYIIVLGYDNELSENAIFGLIIPRLIQLSLMAIFMLSLLWMVRIRIIKPVIELTDITANVARGKGFISLLQSAPSEVELLANEVRKLSDFIQERIRIAQENEHKKSQLIQSKDEAEMRNRIKTEFLGAMSHELRTPLNTIVGFSEMMRNQILGPIGNPQYLQYAEDIHRSSHHLQELVNDVLSLSLAENGLADLQEKPVDVKLVANKALRICSEKLQSLQVSVEITPQETLPKLLVDETRLKQIITNLLLSCAANNAAGGSISLHLSLQQDMDNAPWFVISFTNISNKFTSKNTLNTEAKSTSQNVYMHHASGLSIPLTKALVTMLNAKLEVVSPPGKPTIILVKFPKDRIVY